MRSCYRRFVFIAVSVSAQTSVSFLEMQRTLPRPGDAMSRKLDSLQRQFSAKKLEWPAKYIYVRSFKYDGQLEVWVKNERKEPLNYLKLIRFAHLQDRSDPNEWRATTRCRGFYYINELNPRSNYHLHWA
jgi:murein L,D-transpeptidase YafK